MTSKLDQLKRMTDVVADTGDIEAIRRYTPKDATTNPSLLLKAAQLPHYRELIDAVMRDLGDDRSQSALKSASMNIAVRIGKEITQLVDGKVSTEVDARLSFNIEATVEEAREIIARYRKIGVDPDRLLVKIASTWEGIQAAKLLEQEGIECNLTLLFSLPQAAACAEAGATLISPFVGRILDWHVAHGNAPQTAEEDPGVISVSTIYSYLKQHDYKTVVMGASFRNTGEIEALAGCDRLTISPALLEEMASDDGNLQRRLSPEMAFDAVPKMSFSESSFRWALNEDAMATEKLAEGIRAFAADQIRLEMLLRDWQ